MDFQDPIKKLLKLENSDKPVDPEELLKIVAGAGEGALRVVKRLRRPGGSEDIH